MSEKEILSTQATENVEQTTEETPQAKTYTQEEVDAIVGKKIARTKAKVEKEYQRKYGDLEDVLKAGTGKDNVVELTDTFRNFYKSKGIKIADKPTYSAGDIEVLARAEADEIIRGGLDEVVEEVDRLADIGAANMTAREKAVFRVLAEHRQSMERSSALSEIGVTEDVYNSDDFKDFSKKFAAGVPVKDIYDLYAKTQPKKEIRTMGSMKNSNSGDSAVKEFYSRDEALKFTVDDFNKNPALYNAVVKSMQQWK